MCILNTLGCKAVGIYTLYAPILGVYISGFMTEAKNLRRALSSRIIGFEIASEKNVIFENQTRHFLLAKNPFSRPVIARRSEATRRY